MVVVVVIVLAVNSVIVNLVVVGLIIAGLVIVDLAIVDIASCIAGAPDRLFVRRPRRRGTWIAKDQSKKSVDPARGALVPFVRNAIFRPLYR